jgi:hypothetical protein
MHPSLGEGYAFTLAVDADHAVVSYSVTLLAKQAITLTNAGETTKTSKHKVEGGEERNTANEAMLDAIAKAKETAGIDGLKLIANESIEGTLNVGGNRKSQKTETKSHSVNNAGTENATVNSVASSTTDNPHGNLESKWEIKVQSQEWVQKYDILANGTRSYKTPTKKAGAEWTNVGTTS